MSHVVLTADIHAGVPGRLADIDWALRVVTAYCEQHDIDTVIDLGDLTHDRVALDIKVLCTLHDRLQEARRRGQNWYTFPGNHNMYLKHSWEINGLRPLSGVLNVLEDVCLLELDDRRFWVLPFIHFEQSYMRVLRRLEQQHRDGDVLLTHIGVRGSTLNTCFLLKDWNHVTFQDSPFQRVYTGHFHSHQDLDGQVWYPGSLIPFKFDEGDIPHGFLDLDLETMEHRFVDIWEVGAKLLPGETPAPQFHTVLDHQLPDLTDRDVQGNLIRVVLTRDTTPGEKNEYRQRLLDMGAGAVRWMDSRPEVMAPILQPDQPISQPGELFLRWIEEDAKGVVGLDRKLLIRLETEVRHEGDERYTIIDTE